MELTEVFRVERAPEAVFAYVTDPDRLATWQPTTVDVRRGVSGPFSVGEVFEETHRAFGRSQDSTFRVAAYDPGREFALEALEGPVKLNGRWEFAAVDGGTEVRFTGDGPVPRLLGPFLRRQFRGYHATLKRLLERG